MFERRDYNKGILIIKTYFGVIGIGLEKIKYYFYDQELF